MSKDNISIDDLKKDIKLNEYISANTFPLEIFPEIIIAYIKEAKHVLNYNPEYFSGSILSAFSLAIGNKFKLRIKEGWVSKCNLYLAIVGRAGDGKSHPIKRAFDPITEKESKNIKQYREAFEEYKSNNFIGTTPVAKRFLLKDFTLEALIKIHSDNPVGIGIYSDELMGWLKSMNKYSQGSDLESFLEMWNGHNIIKDRAGGGTTLVESSFVSVIGGIQPSKIKSILNENLEGNGFAYRILWIYPENEKFIPENDLEIDPIHYNNYHLLLNHILDYREGAEDYTLTFTSKAKDAKTIWRNSFLERYHYSEEYIRGTSMKIEAYFYRFLIIIAVVECAYSEMKGSYVKIKSELFVDENTVSKAILLAEYFMENAMSLRSRIIDPFKGLSQGVRNWYKKLPFSFKTDEAITIGDSVGISKSTVEKNLRKSNLFINISHGCYSKQT
jgi:hypothetical protein